MSNQPETKLEQYRAADAPLPEQNRIWPLFGAGFENLGLDGQAMDTPFPTPGPEELLVRHDAVGICFSDIKVIRAGENHPRIHRKMKDQPVVLGHEVALTVIEAGEKLRDQYKVGDRFIVQADIYINGKTSAYGYELQGGFSRYAVVDWRVLNGDHGNYLIPILPSDGYAEVALCEPWACVEASYAVVYRTQWRPGGKSLFAWIDWISADLLLPLCGLLIAIFVGWRMRKEAVRDELFVEHPRFFALWHFLLRYIAPPAVLVILVAGIYHVVAR